MSRFFRIAAHALAASVLLFTLPGVTDAQRPAVPRPAPPAKHAAVVHGHVFIGGYFYDPAFGPYPWWPRTLYPYWYFPVHNGHSEVRLHIAPEEAAKAAVYVDGFYAGVVDDFNNVFQSLPLTPGGHTLVLYLDGYRTVRQNVYLGPGSTFEFREVMERLPAGVISERPQIAPPVPAPPEGTYQPPVTPPTLAAPAASNAVPAAVGFGTLDLYVRPDDVEVMIDGGRWTSADEGHFVVQLPAGRHRVEVRKAVFRFASDVDVRDGDTTSLNLSLMPSGQK